jgi:TPP-dependent pyruvate/acetoin dehydrogenase alpha subunit
LGCFWLHDEAETCTICEICDFQTTEELMAPALDVATRQEMLRRMLEIRIAEEEIQKMFLQNLIRGTTHLCIGQEACSAGVAWAMQPGDTMTCTYRGHGQYGRSLEASGGLLLREQQIWRIQRPA